MSLLEQWKREIEEYSDILENTLLPDGKGILLCDYLLSYLNQIQEVRDALSELDRILNDLCNEFDYKIYNYVVNNPKEFIANFTWELDNVKHFNFSSFNVSYKKALQFTYITRPGSLDELFTEEINISDRVTVEFSSENDIIVMLLTWNYN